MSHVYDEYAAQMNQVSGYNYNVRVMELSWLLSYEDNVSNLLRAYHNGRNVLAYRPAHAKATDKHTPTNYNNALRHVQECLLAHGVQSVGGHEAMPYISSSDVQQFVSS